LRQGDAVNASFEQPILRSPRSYESRKAQDRCGCRATEIFLQAREFRETGDIRHQVCSPYVAAKDYQGARRMNDLLAEDLRTSTAQLRMTLLTGQGEISQGHHHQEISNRAG